MPRSLEATELEAAWHALDELETKIGAKHWSIARYVHDKFGDSRHTVNGAAVVHMETQMVKGREAEYKRQHDDFTRTLLKSSTSNS